MLLSKCYYRCFICQKIVGEGKEKQQYRMICHGCKFFYEEANYEQKLPFHTSVGASDSDYGFGSWYKDKWFGNEYDHWNRGYWS